MWIPKFSEDPGLCRIAEASCVIVAERGKPDTDGALHGDEGWGFVAMRAGRG
jgi:hypothetical protein